MKTPHILLIALVVVCLVPYGWIAQQSPGLSYLFNVVFHSQIAHRVGHSAIFAAIGALSLQIIPALRGRPAAYVALIMLAALGQESFQILYKGRLYLGDTLGDIVTDLIAAAAVWVVIPQQAAQPQTEGASQP